MAKKVKCIECYNYTNFALPRAVDFNNIDYAEQCLAIAKRSFVCGQTMKTKKKGHEQYCKHFCKALYNNDNTKAIEELEIKINEYLSKVSNEE